MHIINIDLASRRIISTATRLEAWCLLICLLVTASQSSGQTARGGGNTQDTNKEIRQKLLEPALKMLKAKGVPFETELLLNDDWRSRIDTAIAGMPEMGQTRRITGPMEGVYMAGLVLLPRRVYLTGDTFILSRELAPDDENSTITITGGYRLVIFNIGDSRKFEAMERRRSRDHFLNIDIEASCAVLGIAPLYLGSYRCRGMSHVAGWKVRS